MQVASCTTRGSIVDLEPTAGVASLLLQAESGGVCLGENEEEKGRKSGGIFGSVASEELSAKAEQTTQTRQISICRCGS